MSVIIELDGCDDAEVVVNADWSVDELLAAARGALDLGDNAEDYELWVDGEQLADGGVALARVGIYGTGERVRLGRSTLSIAAARLQSAGYLPHGRAVTGPNQLRFHDFRRAFSQATKEMPPNSDAVRLALQAMHGFLREVPSQGRRVNTLTSEPAVNAQFARGNMEYVRALVEGGYFSLPGPHPRVALTAAVAGAAWQVVVVLAQAGVIHADQRLCASYFREPRHRVPTADGLVWEILRGGRWRTPLQAALACGAYDTAQSLVTRAIADNPAWRGAWGGWRAPPEWAEEILKYRELYEAIRARAPRACAGWALWAAKEARWGVLREVSSREDAWVKEGGGGAAVCRHAALVQTRTGDSALSTLAENGHWEQVEALAGCAAGAAAMQPMRDGTPLVLAAVARGAWAAATALVEHASALPEDVLGAVLVTAARNRAWPTVTHLVASGVVDISAKDPAGDTCITAAAAAGAWGDVRRLLDIGCDPRVPGRRGRRCVDLARAAGEHAVVDAVEAFLPPPPRAS